MLHGNDGNFEVVSKFYLLCKWITYNLNSNLTKDDEADLRRVQKATVRVIMESGFTKNSDALLY